MKRIALKRSRKPIKRTGVPKRKTAVWKINKARLAKRQAIYDAYMQSPEWTVIRAAVLQRDQWECVQCGARGTGYLYPDEIRPDLFPPSSKKHKRVVWNQLHVHHKTYARFGHENLEDLITLCKECHDKEHSGRFIKPRGLRQ